MYVKLKSGRLEFFWVIVILVFSLFDLREIIFVGFGVVVRFVGKFIYFVFYWNSFLKK